jgi:CRP/FNR family transcriptional regulator, cyclic AMP receptor protein
MPDVAAAMGSVPIFSGLSGRQLKSLAKTAKVLSYPTGTRIVKQGEQGIAMYVLLSGSVEVRQGTQVLARLDAGQFFGEMTLADEQPRSADVVTVGPTECAVLSRWEFWGLARTEPEIIVGILREMARRLRQTNKSLSE